MKGFSVYCQHSTISLGHVIMLNNYYAINIYKYLQLCVYWPVLSIGFIGSGISASFSFLFLAPLFFLILWIWTACGGGRGWGWGAVTRFWQIFGYFWTCWCSGRFFFLRGRFGFWMFWRFGFWSFGRSVFGTFTSGWFPSRMYLGFGRRWSPRITASRRTSRSPATAARTSTIRLCTSSGQRLTPAWWTSGTPLPGARSPFWGSPGTFTRTGA